jgi:hypothetical protein
MSVGDGEVAAAAYYRRGADWPDDENPAIKETLGLPNLFYHRGYLKSREVWICPSASELAKSFGNTYVTQITRTIAKMQTRERAAYKVRDTFYIYDNYLYRRPQDSNVPRSVGNSVVTFPTSQWVFPHRYLGKIKFADSSTGKGRQGAVNMLFQDGVVGITTYLDKGGSAPVSFNIRGE